jgi:hypothetical protein
VLTFGSQVAFLSFQCEHKGTIIVIFLNFHSKQRAYQQSVFLIFSMQARGFIKAFCSWDFNAMFLCSLSDVLFVESTGGF